MAWVQHEDDETDSHFLIKFHCSEPLLSWSKPILSLDLEPESLAGIPNLCDGLSLFLRVVEAERTKYVFALPSECAYFICVFLAPLQKECWYYIRLS